MSYLDNVLEENCFVLSNGAKIRNLDELSLAIKSSDNSVFYNHVGNGRNDFANWIRACVKHEELANTLMGISEKQKFIELLDSEIDFIKNPKLKETSQFFKNTTSADVQTDVFSSAKNNVHSDVSPVSSPVSSPETSPALQSTQTTQASESSPSIAIVQASSANSNTLSAASVVLLDFEQFLAPIVQEIEQEIMQWSDAI
ncbi:MAG: hypothetical protein ACP5NV_03705 [Candidatus Woesearchaeota archaeon]